VLDRLLRQDVASLDSDMWYRVARTTPRLSVHARVTRQNAAGTAWYVVDDPISGEFFRVSEAAYFFVGLLDGRRTVDQAYDAASVQLGDLAPSQRECVDTLSRLQLHGLLTGDQPLTPEQVRRRQRDASTRRLRTRLGMGLSPSLPLINPEPLLERIAPLTRAVFSRVGLIVWALAVSAGLYAAISNVDRFGSQLSGVLAPSNLLWLGIVFLVLRAWHEFGHACAVKAFGGRCTEVGLIFMALVIPFPYCDASASWRFARTAHRVLVGLGGMLFETFLAAIAAIVWAASEPGLVHTIAYNTMIVSGVTTVLFNANPLLRYDGYYILCDLAAAPNLWNRSREMLIFLMERIAFGIPGARVPAVRDRGEFWLLVSYAALSYPYRFVLLFSIVWLLWTDANYFGLGVVLAIAAAAVWLVWPALKSLSYLLWSSRLLGRRVRAVSIVAGVLGALVLALGAMPMPAPAYATAVVHPAALQTVRAPEDGFIDAVLVPVGARVEVGQALAILRNPEIEAEVARTTAQHERARAEADAAAGSLGTTSGSAGSGGSSAAANAIVARLVLEQAQRDEARARARLDALTIRATVAGRVATLPGSPSDLASAEGRYARRGTPLFAVADTDAPTLRALVSDREFGRAFDGALDRPTGNGAMPRAWARVRGDAARVLPLRITRADPAASRTIGEAALTADAGGEILMDPSDPESSRALRPYFLVEMTPEGTHTLIPGTRARIRFDAGREPLAWQWIRRIRQSLADRASIT
jgi:putative peptide zinc metalloprotease protein